MGIINRLNIFINKLGKTSSQFADEIKLPRPSVSQILNGRNKKISNEVIERIHQTYPSLNISWLLFGEGSMLISDTSLPYPDTTTKQPSSSSQQQTVAVYKTVDSTIANPANNYHLRSENNTDLSSSNESSQFHNSIKNNYERYGSLNDSEMSNRNNPEVLENSENPKNTESNPFLGIKSVKTSSDFTNYKQKSEQTKDSSLLDDNKIESVENSLNRQKERKIKSIIILYTDNTFENFTPDKL